MVSLSDQACKVCDNKNSNQIFTASEKMFGYGGEFKYLLCGNCSSMQLMNPPINISQYYPSNYYSFNAKESSKLKIWMKYKRFEYSLYDKGFIGKLLQIYYKTPSLITWLRVLDLKKTDKIIDIGCGNGHLILDLYEMGYKNISGIDPYIKNDIIYHNQLTISKKDIFGLEGEYDLIMMHHSFEHLSDPFIAIAEIRKHLAEKGTLLIRIPVADSYAFKHYQADWVNLDAPRHFFIFSEAGMKILAKNYGYMIDRIIYDSDEFQFLGSELYKKGKVLKDFSKSLFKKNDINDFKIHATSLNEKGLGDQACFYLKKFN